MPNPLETFTQQVNWTHYHGQLHGHYESFFQRANHPTRPLAFWIRYTIFCPKDHLEEALGELWAVYFDGKTGRHLAVKKEVPLHPCTFDTSAFYVEIDELNSLSQSIRAKGSFEYFLWKFRSETPEISIEGTISAPREAFVGLSYANPPGGSKHCLNTKIASCRLHIIHKRSRMEETLTSSNRAAFEILTDDRQHGISISA